MIICKFGGTSTTAMCALNNIKQLALNKERMVFVFSAVGKAWSNDKKMTDLLISYCKAHKQNSSLTIIRHKIINKFKMLAQNTNVNSNILKEFESYEQKYLSGNPCYDDCYLISRGEYLTAKIMAQFLNLKFVPAENLMAFKNGKPNLEAINKKLNTYIEKYGQIVTCGFYGIENKKIKLLSRGGGDTSGAILSKSVGAKTYEIFTDVSGVFEVNPNICPSRQIKNLSFETLKQLTKLDAKVVHPECAKILLGSDTTLQVASTFDLSLPATIVTNYCKEDNLFVGFKILKEKVKIIAKTKNNNLIACYENKLNFKEKIKKIYEKIKKIHNF